MKKKDKSLKSLFKKKTLCVVSNCIRILRSKYFHLDRYIFVLFALLQFIRNVFSLENLSRNTNKFKSFINYF